MMTLPGWRYDARMSTKTYSPEQESEIIRRYRLGAGATELARLFGGGQHTIYRLLRRKEERIRHRSGHDALPITAEMVAEILRRYAAGESQPKIAHSLGIHQGRLSAIMIA